MPELPRLAILVGDRSRGSNLAALIAAASRGELPLTPALAVAGRPDAPALEVAIRAGVATAVVPAGGSDYGERLADRLAAAGVGWIALAGYLRLLPTAVLERWPDRVLNVHPALLPKFGGKGMYGRHVHEAVLAAGERESGCTVHRVDARYDEGRILVQLRCPVRPDDTPETLGARVLRLEHAAFPLGFRLALMEAEEDAGRA